MISEIARKQAPPDTPLSAILLTQGGFDTFAKSLGCLLGQSRADALEIVLFVEQPDAIAPARVMLEASREIGGWILLQGALGERTSTGLECVRLASCPVAAWCEDHSFVSANWCAELTDAFAAAPSVVAAAPAMHNGNPASSISRAQFAMFFGDYSARLHHGGQRVVDSLPGHNTAYRRDLLMAVPDARTLLLAENLLQQRLLAASPGGTLVVCSDATTDHVNMSRWGPAAQHALLGGRIFAHQRAVDAGWSGPRRILQAALFPLAAAVRLCRKHVALRRETSGTGWVADFCAAAILATLHAAGEAVGLLLGVGSAPQAYARMEGDRAQGVRATDVHLLRPLP